MSNGLDRLIADGKIQAVRVRLQADEQPQRRLFVCEDFIGWADTLSGDQRERSLLSERGELATIFADFIAGRPRIGMINEVNPPRGAGIFRLKSATFRLYGWCPARQAMILAFGVRKDDILSGKAPKDRESGKRVVAIRRALGATEILRGQWYEILRL